MELLVLPSPSARPHPAKPARRIREFSAILLAVVGTLIAVIGVVGFVNVVRPPIGRYAPLSPATGQLPWPWYIDTATGTVYRVVFSGAESANRGWYVERRCRPQEQGSAHYGQVIDDLGLESCPTASLTK